MNPSGSLAESDIGWRALFSYSVCSADPLVAPQEGYSMQTKGQQGGLIRPPDTGLSICLVSNNTHPTFLWLWMYEWKLVDFISYRSFHSARKRHLLILILCVKDMCSGYLLLMPCAHTQFKIKWSKSGDCNGWSMLMTQLDTVCICTTMNLGSGFESTSGFKSGPFLYFPSSLSHAHLPLLLKQKWKNIITLPMVFIHVCERTVCLSNQENQRTESSTTDS